MKRLLFDRTLVLVLAVALTWSIAVPSPSSALMYDYTYTGNHFTYAYTTDSSHSTPSGIPYETYNLTIDIKSPTPLNFSQLDQSTTPGLTITMSDGNATMYYDSTTSGVFPSLYFYSSQDNLTPDSWLVELWSIGEAMSSTNTASLIDDGCLFGVRTAGIAMGSTSPGTWSLNVTETAAPVPEPTSILLIMVGLVGLALMQLRRKIFQRDRLANTI